MEFHELHPLKELIYDDKHITLLFDKENHTAIHFISHNLRYGKLENV